VRRGGERKNTIIKNGRPKKGERGKEGGIGFSRKKALNQTDLTKERRASDTPRLIRGRERGDGGEGDKTEGEVEKIFRL